MDEPVEFNSVGDTEFGERLECVLCDVVVYVKTGDFMTFSASHECPNIEEHDG